MPASVSGNVLAESYRTPVSNSTCAVLCTVVMSCIDVTKLSSCLDYCPLLEEYTVQEKLKHLTILYVYRDIKSCGTPLIEGGRAIQVKGHIGDRVTYKCHFDHEFCLDQPEPIISCLPNGKWTRPPAMCQQTVWKEFGKEQIPSVTFDCPVERNAMIEVNGKVTSKTYGNILCSLEASSNNITYKFNLDIVHRNNSATVTSKDKLHIRWNSIPSSSKHAFKIRKNALFTLKIQLTRRYIKSYVNTMRMQNFYMTENYSIFGLKISGDILTWNIKLYPYSFLF